MKPPRALLALVPCALLWAAPSRAQLAVQWDCYLAPEDVPCEQLETAFFQGTPLLVRASTEVDVTVQVRSARGDSGTDYVLTVVSSDGRANVRLVDSVPTSFSDDGAQGGGSGGGGGLGGGADTGGGGGRGTGGGDGRGRLKRGGAVLLRLVSDLQRAVAPLLASERPASMDGGRMTLRLGDPSDAPGQARAEQADTPWYASPTLTGDVTQAALLRAQGRAQLDANWSASWFRLLGSGWGGFTFLSAPGPREEDPAQTFGFAVAGLDVTAAHVLWRGVSVGATARAAHAPDQNQLLRLDGYVGLEWVLVPLLLTHGGNLGVRYVVGAEHQEFVHLNVEKSFEGNFLRHRAVAFGAWHFPRMDLNGSLAAASIVDDLRFSDVSASAGLAWRVTNDLSISLTGTASYRNGLVNAPDNLNELDPLERFAGGANYGAVNYALSASLVYVFGNSLLLRQDQRWSNATEP